MIIYLIFCASFHETVCSVPKEMPNLHVCNVVGQHMQALAGRSNPTYDMGPTSGKYECLTFK